MNYTISIIQTKFKWILILKQLVAEIKLTKPHFKLMITLCNTISVEGEIPNSRGSRARI